MYCNNHVVWTSKGLLFYETAVLGLGEQSVFTTVTAVTAVVRFTIIELNLATAIVIVNTRVKCY